MLMARFTWTLRPASSMDFNKNTLKILSMAPGRFPIATSRVPTLGCA
jgi:hypothetical protein